MIRIAIIGAGLSGRLLALNLLRYPSANSTASILMFDRSNERSLGPAYSGTDDCLRLNVPAEQMGAFSNDPEHFLNWIRDKGMQADRKDFLPRRLYHDYILDLMSVTLKTPANGSTLKQICGKVTDIETEDGRAILQVENKGAFVVDKAVLALGNFPPRNPLIKNRSALKSRRYIQNPWDLDILDSLSGQETVFLIGTGQTMVDLVLALHQRKHQGPIVALSRRGFLPLAHHEFEHYQSFFREIEGSRFVLEIFQTVRKHLDLAEEMGIDRRAVIDSLRPYSQVIWLNLPDKEKRRFLRHLFRYWEVIRSRIPPESEAIIKAMRVSGQLEILAGRIHDFVETKSTVEVKYSRRGSAGQEFKRAALLINCIGPESDYRRINHLLVWNLMKRELIRPGPARLGIDAHPNGAIIGQNGVPSKILYTLGSTMRGVLWEVLAVPEIRVQAEQLAQILLNGNHE